MNSLSYTIFFEDYIECQKNREDIFKKEYSTKIKVDNITNIGGDKILTHYSILNNGTLFIFSSISRRKDKIIDPEKIIQDTIQSNKYSNLQNRLKENTFIPKCVNVGKNESLDDALMRDHKKLKINNLANIRIFYKVIMRKIF